MPRLLPFLIFLAVALTLVGGMHYYIWVRFVRDLHLPHPWVRILTVAIIAAAIAMPATLFAVRLLPSGAVRPAIWIAFIWMGVAFLLVAFLGIADAGRLVVFVIARVRGPSDPDPARRLLLARSLAAGVGGVVAGLSALGLRSALAGVQIKELDVKLRGLPPQLAGFRLVQISDVHVGPLLRKDWVAHVVERVRSLSPDLVAITGDLVDGRVHELREHVAPLARIHAPRGVYFVTGNHEYYSGAAAWVAELERLGVKVLMNEHVLLRHGNGALVIAGVPDYSAHHFDPAQRSDPAAALAGAPHDAAVKLLLAHQPRSAEAAADAGFDLQLSGHTHGGQFWPWNLFVRLQQPFTAGLHRLGRMWIYISRGTGYWGPPMRFGIPSEITRIRLARG